MQSQQAQHSNYSKQLAQEVVQCSDASGPVESSGARLTSVFLRGLAAGKSRLQMGATAMDGQFNLEAGWRLQVHRLL